MPPWESSPENAGLAIPKALVQDPRREEWYDLLWACRGKQYEQPEYEIEQRYKDEKLLVGVCCSQSNAQIRNMFSKYEMQPMKLRDENAAEQ